MAVAPVGMLVIRAGVEEGSERPLRAEVRLTADSGRGFQRELTFSEAGPVEALVRTWLADLLAGSAGPRAPHEASSRDGHATVTEPVDDGA